MRLVLAYGGYYPYTQKPVDYQPYRPVYLFRGPPPDAGFSYGLFEDEEEGKKYYAEIGLVSFSPLSGKQAKLIEELTSQQMENLFNDFKKDLTTNTCDNCSSEYLDSFKNLLKDRLGDVFCHKCGFKLGQCMDDNNNNKSVSAATDQIIRDPSVQNFIQNGISILIKSTQMKELIERLSSRYGISLDKAKKDVLLALKNSIM